MADAALMDGLTHSDSLGHVGGEDPWRLPSVADSGPPQPSARRASQKGASPALQTSLDDDNEGRPAAPSTPADRWDIVRKRVVNAVGASLCFRTLRDMYGEFMLDPEKLTFVKTLGEGNHGKVDKYKYSDESGESFIAVKRLKSSMVSAQDMLDFIREVELLKKLSHDCIATYRGSGTLPPEDTGREGEQTEEQDHDLYLATECLDGGTLRDILIREMQEKHGTQHKYTLLEAAVWMLDVARGMAYLHGAEPVVMHRDLKLENIMLTDDGRAKIVDFGLHKVIDSWLREYVKDDEGLYEMSGGMGAYIYMAPESLKSNRYNHLVDVYAFGIILWELMHYEMLINRVSLHGTTDDLKNFAKYVSREAWRPPISNDLPKGIVDLIEDCWSQSPADRPEFREILGRLRDVIADLKLQSKRPFPEQEHAGPVTLTRGACEGDQPCPSPRRRCQWLCGLCWN